MNHQERLKLVAKLLKKNRPPLEFYDKQVYPKSSEVAIMNLYDWFVEQGLVRSNYEV